MFEYSCLLFSWIGQERFTSMTRVYYKDAHACIIMFDLTAKQTFMNALKWKKDLDSKCTLPDGSLVPCILLANKVIMYCDTYIIILLLYWWYAKHFIKSVLSNFQYIFYSVHVSLSCPKALYHLESDNLFGITLVLADWLGWNPYHHSSFCTLSDWLISKFKLICC